MMLTLAWMFVAFIAGGSVAMAISIAYLYFLAPPPREREDMVDACIRLDLSRGDEQALRAHRLRLVRR